MWTQERIKRFWEACGFKYLPIRPLPDKEPHPTLRYWLYPDGAASNEQLSITDLNALEKWALPLLIKEYSELEIHFDYLIKYNKWNCSLLDGFYDEGNSKWMIAIASGETIALALAEAIEKAIIDENRTPEDS